ncbi:exodeoxyribonuclease VII large subunit [Chromobacterium haemolyticum]|nr:exodeoxyribonuclease VII large subunit [Chromobacterium haemolyticum]
MFFTTTQNDVISVSSLNRMARDLLESGLPPMWIGGEISNLTLAASGHAYFSLKDGGAQVRCVMFRGKVSQLPFRPAEGMQVELKGTVTLYEARGDFQIIDQMRSAGLGRLYEAFEKLKAKLQAEGLFNPAHKRPLPPHPAAIGIVTSPAAAALRDVVSTLRRRMPCIPVILYPAQVQGEGSAQQVADAIRRAGERREVDVLIVCRGGGSIEDLWSFNEEIVARAVAASPIPTVSGVGHETDFTICDFVADKRAPTPTAAAELVSPSREHLSAQLETAKRGLERARGRLLTDKSQQLDYLARRLAHPGEKLQRQREALQRQQERLQRRLSGLFEQRRWALQLADSKLQRRRPDLAHAVQAMDRLQTRLQRARQDLLNRQTQKLDTLAATLLALNPEAVLARGYAIVQKQDGTAVKSPEELRNRERVSLRLAEGSTEALIDHPQGAQPSLF